MSAKSILKPREITEKAESDSPMWKKSLELQRKHTTYRSIFA